MGRAFRGLSPDKARERRLDLRRAVERCFDEATRRRVDAVIIAGDLFDTENVRGDEAATVWECARRLDEACGARVVIAPGNHDPLQVGSPYLAADLPANVHVFRDTDWTSIEVEGCGIVWGIAYDRARPGRNVLAALRECLTPQPQPQVAVVHAVHRGLATEEENYYPFGDMDLAGLPLAYLALGHAHSMRSVGPGRPPARYPGTPELLDHEPTAGQHGALLVTIEAGLEAHAEEVPIGRRRCVAVRVDVDDCSSQVQIANRIADHADADAIARVELRGHRREDLELDLEELRAELLERFFWVEIRDATVLPPDLEAPEGTVKGEFVRRLREELAQTEDADRRRIIEDALRYGVLALDGKLRA